MNLFEGFKKLTQSYDEEDDFFEEADETFKAPKLVSEAQKKFENTYSGSSVAEPMADEDEEEEDSYTEGGSLFGSFKRSGKARGGRQNFAGAGGQVILFSPKNFDDCGEIANHILNSQSVVMTLEGIPTDMARRLLDFMSGIAFALQGKITPISSKTYFVTPQNVDIVGSAENSAEPDNF